MQLTSCSGEALNGLVMGARWVIPFPPLLSPAFRGSDAVFWKIRRPYQSPQKYCVLTFPHQHCRVRHLKCDDEEPSCSRCVAAGVPCIRWLSVKFRHKSNPSVSNSEGGSGSYGKSQLGYEHDQPWCRTNHPLTFIDETRDLLSLYDNSSDGENEDQQTDPSPDFEGSTAAVTAPGQANSVRVGSVRSLDIDSIGTTDSIAGTLDASETRSPFKKRRVDPARSSFGSSTLGLSPSLAFRNPAVTERLIRSSSHRHDNFTRSNPSALRGPILPSESSDLPSAASLQHLGAPATSHTDEDAISQIDRLTTLPLEVPIWPLQSKTEARLFRYYVNNIGKLFDICDPERHFALVVPCRAITCTPLMNAMFAVSARHLRRTNGFYKNASDDYYHRCLSTLVPMLGDWSALMDENLFAATVLLRHLEEVDVPLSGADSNTYLLGNQLFAAASAPPSLSIYDAGGYLQPTFLTGLRRAAFLVAVREEIYTAFVSQRSISAVFSSSVIDRSLDVEADDSTWANRMVFHVVDVVRFCFEEGVDIDQSLARYDELVEYGRSWYEKKPISFCAMFYKDSPALGLPEGASPATPREGCSKIFPEIWLISEAVSTGLQHYHLAQILLIAYNPRAPRLGPNRVRFLNKQTEDIKREVLTIVGIARSNSGCHPNYATACMSIAMAGERFEHYWEQVELIKFLKESEAAYAWPTITAQRHLAEAWGWSQGITPGESW
ncbi:hypothetical protein BJ170DRAFT_624793 [Xylariales sp. AK1849]|nr:hypothetical protein BJ170DRAFT_624793 [Xylariales sp. AK1849]